MQGASSLVRYETAGPHIAVVTLDRPEKRNAISPAMAQAIEAIVQKTEADPEIRVVILTSSDDRAFCAGADLAAVASDGGLGMETVEGGFAGFVSAKRLKPWIAAVEGMALAGGCEICLACDMIVASQAAQFGLPEVKRSLVAAGGGVYRLPLLLPRNLALEMIATGDPIDAARAHQGGMVNRLVAPGEALSAAKVLAETIAANAPVAVQQSLAAARASAGLSEPDAAALAKAALAKVRATQDYLEGPKAFVEKRPPVWTGR